MRHYSKPKQIDSILTIQLQNRMFALADSALKRYYRETKRNGWRYYVVCQDRGRCYFAPKIITIPTWVMLGQANARNKAHYWEWYIAHEIAHVYAGIKAQHGPVFQHWLISVCPPYALQYETGYKPQSAARAAIAAGIIPDDLL